MSMRRYILFSLLVLSAVFFAISWLNHAAMNSLSRKSMVEQSQSSYLKSFRMDPGSDSEKRPMMNRFSGYNNKTSKRSRSPIELPQNPNEVDLSGWEVFDNEGEEHFVQSGVDYLDGEKLIPALRFKNRKFYLNDMPFRIFSGALHYFRVVPDYWLDRLKKLKACGLNTVETYVPWNLHEPTPGKFDFEGMLDIRRFLRIAAELGLYVILRPGPYICSEFDFGGLPGWLLADPGMKVRTNHRVYLNHVNKFWSVLLPMVLDFQFSEGGPIIMFQVENEYGSYGVDGHHVKFLLYMMRQYGVRELVATSDNGHQFQQKHPSFDVSKYALNTINSNHIKAEHVAFIQRQNKHFPILVMELWCGWFDMWNKEEHVKTDLYTLGEALDNLMTNGSSFNLYMFHGGTNFGFTSGAVNFSKYETVTTSYDYDAPLTEAGDTTPKYFFVREQLLRFYKSIGIPFLPEVPPNSVKANYGDLKVAEIMEWGTLLSVLPMLHQENRLDYMETYAQRLPGVTPIGYIVYSHMLRPGMTWSRVAGHRLMGYVSGRLTAILDGETFYVGSDHAPIMKDEFLWDKKMETQHVQNWHEYEMEFEDVLREPHWLYPFYQKVKALTEGNEERNKTARLQIDLMVENQGRVNYVNGGSPMFDLQRRGIQGPVLQTVFGMAQEEWSVKMLHFDKTQCETISKSSAWMTMKAYGRMLEDREQTEKAGPTLYKAYLTISGAPRDTFVKLKDWTKGVVVVNNFNLGRYWSVGPQKTLYLPAPLLRQGANEILVFEERSRGPHITLQDTPELG